MDSQVEKICFPNWVKRWAHFPDLKVITGAEHMEGDLGFMETITVVGLAVEWSPGDG